MTEPTTPTETQVVQPALTMSETPATVPAAATENPLGDFAQFNLPPALAEKLAAMNYKTPTPVQMQSIPAALAGRDILASAQTGTGKTAAFGIPLMTKLLSNHRGSALVMTPTRELAAQVMTVLQQMLGRYSTIKTALLIGGESMGPQFAQLKARPRLIVGTPGRINDHLERGTLMLHDTNFLVLDETDRMLDMGFSVQLDKITKFLPKQRQTLLFSATLPDNIMKLSKNYLNDPVRVKVGESNVVAQNIKQEVIHCGDDNKYDLLVKELTERQGTIIVFVKTKRGADRMATKLHKQKFSAEAIHGDLKQNQRDRVIAAFRAKKHRILIATDVAARGLDIPHIEHVINYDLPHAPEDFIHRIGRTARAGAEGSTICFVSHEDRNKWRAIQRLMDPLGAAMDNAPRGPRNASGGKPGGGAKRRGGGFWKNRRGNKPQSIAA